MQPRNLHHTELQLDRSAAKRATPSESAEEQDALEALDGQHTSKKRRNSSSTLRLKEDVRHVLHQVAKTSNKPMNALVSELILERGQKLGLAVPLQPPPAPSGGSSDVSGLMLDGTSSLHPRKDGSFDAYGIVPRPPPATSPAEMAMRHAELPHTEPSSSLGGRPSYDGTPQLASHSQSMVSTPHGPTPEQSSPNAPHPMPPRIDIPPRSSLLLGAEQGVFKTTVPQIRLLAECLASGCWCGERYKVDVVADKPDEQQVVVYLRCTGTHLYRWESLQPNVTTPPEGSAQQHALHEQ